MVIRIIQLASKKIKLRKISKGMLNETINRPDQIVEGYGGRVVRQKIYNVGNNQKLLRVVCEEKDEDIIVVTAYLTSQVKKYWKDKNEN